MDIEQNRNHVHGKKHIIFHVGRGWQGTAKTYVSVNRQENLFHHLFSFPTPPSFLTVFFYMKRGEKTTQMWWNGQWSGTVAFKALPLPCLSLFIFYLNKCCSIKQEAHILRNKSIKNQMGLISPCLFFFPFFSPYKIILGALTTTSSFSITKIIFYKSSTEQVNTSQTSM